MLARRARYGLAERCGIDITVRRNKRRAFQSRCVDQRKQIPGLRRRDNLHLKIKTARHGRQPPRFEHPVAGRRQPERAGLFPVELHPFFVLQTVIHRDGFLQHPCRVSRRSQLPHEAGRVPCRPFGEAGAFQQNNVFLAQPGQVVGDRATDNPAADDQMFCRVLRHDVKPSPMPSWDHKAARA